MTGRVYISQHIDRKNFYFWPISLENFNNGQENQILEGPFNTVSHVVVTVIDYLVEHINLYSILILTKNPAYGSQGICQCVGIVAPIPKTKKISYIMFHVSHVTCNVSHVIVHMPPVTNGSSYRNRPYPCYISHYAQQVVLQRPKNPKLFI